jgi:DNA-binding NarL/FixJ family response regulator
MGNSRFHTATVLVADSHEAVREFVITFLRDKGLQAVGEAADGTEAVSMCEQLRPDIAVLDTALPRLNGFEAATRIAKVCPATKVILLTVDTIKTFADEALRAGGVGLAFKERIVRDLPAAIEAALEGNTFLSRQD